MPFYLQIKIVRIFNAFIIHTFKQGEFLEPGDFSQAIQRRRNEWEQRI